MHAEAHRYPRLRSMWTEPDNGTLQPLGPAAPTGQTELHQKGPRDPKTPWWAVLLTLGLIGGLTAALFFFTSDTVSLEQASASTTVFAPPTTLEPVPSSTTTTTSPTTTTVVPSTTTIVTEDPEPLPIPPTRRFQMGNPAPLGNFFVQLYAAIYPDPVAFRTGYRDPEASYPMVLVDGAGVRPIAAEEKNKMYVFTGYGPNMTRSVPDMTRADLSKLKIQTVLPGGIILDSYARYLPSTENNTLTNLFRLPYPVDQIDLLYTLDQYQVFYSLPLESASQADNSKDDEPPG